MSSQSAYKPQVILHVESFSGFYCLILYRMLKKEKKSLIECFLSIEMNVAGSLKNYYLFTGLVYQLLTHAKPRWCRLHPLTMSSGGETDVR